MPNSTITRSEAELMMTGMLKEYERETVEPRHKETQSELADIKEIVSQGRGMLRLVGWVGSLCAVAWTVLQIVKAVKG